MSNNVFRIRIRSDQDRKIPNLYRIRIWMDLGSLETWYRCDSNSLLKDKSLLAFLSISTSLLQFLRPLFVYVRMEGFSLLLVLSAALVMVLASCWLSLEMMTVPLSSFHACFQYGRPTFCRLWASNHSRPNREIFLNSLHMSLPPWQKSFLYHHEGVNFVPSHRPLTRAEQSNDIYIPKPVVGESPRPLCISPLHNSVNEV